MHRFFHAAQKWPESLTQRLRNQRPAFFGAENSVEKELTSDMKSFSRPFGTYRKVDFPGVETPGYSHDVPPGRRTLSNRTTGIPNRSAALEKNVQAPGRRLKSAQQVLEGRPFPSPDSPK